MCRKDSGLILNQKSCAFTGHRPISVKIIVTKGERCAKISTWKELHRNGEH